MKTATGFFLFFYLLAPAWTQGQGISCSNPYPLSLDGVTREFAVSSSSGACISCTMSGFSGNNGRITFFSFTTDASSRCVQLELFLSEPATMEVLLYNNCGAGTPGPAGGIEQHAMCFSDGSGIWAPDLFNNLAPSTTYYLRVRTGNGFSGSLFVTGRFVQPQNDICAGAMGIETTPVFDNNACHTPGPGVPAGQLCAMTLENTAWYTFVVENDGSCIITIDSIACDNGNGNNVNGFQIGFFGGTCSGLTPLTCFSGTGGMIQGTVSSLTAGSRIYVGVDGYSGSNCRYRIRATNAVVLPLHFRSFFAGAAGNDNVLVWDMETGDSSLRYEVQRSVDGQHFDLAGSISATTNLSPGQRQTFRDTRPPLRCYYRIKAMDLTGRESFSPVREVRRPGQVTLDQLTVTPGSLTFRLTSFKATRCSAFLTDRSGLLMHRSAFYCEQGSRNYRIPLSGIVSAGPFFLHLRYPDGSQISRQVFIPAY